MLLYILPLIAGYLLGSISFSYLIGKWVKGIDIRHHGSGNAGATNTLRVLGVGPAISVLAMDVVKGILAVWISIWAFPEEQWLHALTGLSVILGHNWPVFFGFKGGKGIATTIGVTASLFFFSALYAGIIAILSIVWTRYVSLGSLIFTGLLPLFVFWQHGIHAFFWLTLVIACFAFTRHRSNLVKLVKGQENKLGSKGTKGSKKKTLEP
ncbi:glycerol-3-phosphate 1-O-acyltransferase PlsY [Marinicrinis sediminis]|uniref:Glycerol-3-phosphate acyltransferase n=1 Tax=Marinicrinis sediminis TaxID=1652465 RepID=A0ABW5RE77_9BACL